MNDARDHPCLDDLCKALGWQGGTIHQVIAEIARLRQFADKAQPALARASQWGDLYNAASRLMAALGYRGELTTRSDEAALLMRALEALDGGEYCPGLMPAITNIGAA